MNEELVVRVIQSEASGESVVQVQAPGSETFTVFAKQCKLEVKGSEGEVLLNPEDILTEQQNGKAADESKPEMPPPPPTPSVELIAKSEQIVLPQDPELQRMSSLEPSSEQSNSKQLSVSESASCSDNSCRGADKITEQLGSSPQAGIVTEVFTDTIVTAGPPLRIDISSTSNKGGEEEKSTPGLSSPRSTHSSQTSPWKRGWHKGKLIGKGSYGSVFLGVKTADGSLMAVKSINVANIGLDSLRNVAREVEVMSSMAHENIVQYLGANLDEASGELQIFMEYVQGGTLGSLVRLLDQPLQEVTAAGYTRQILRGVAYLHANGVIHRDLKGDNILVQQNGVIKLADFGTSKFMDSEGQAKSAACTIVGTPLWMAPEVINSSNKKVGYSYSADIWSVGIVICELLAKGKTPWPVFDSCWQAVFTIGCWKEELPPEVPEGLSDACMDLLRTCLNPDPALRKSAAELLVFPWLQLQVDTPKEESPTWFQPVGQIMKIGSIEELKNLKAFQNHRTPTMETHDDTFNNSEKERVCKESLSSSGSETRHGSGEAERLQLALLKAGGVCFSQDQTVLGTPKPAVCDGCSAEYKNTEELADHKESDSCGALYGCGEPDCPLFFGSRTRLRRHFGEAHAKSKKVTCDGCSGIFANAVTMENHKEANKCGILFGCSHPECNLAFASKARHAAHIIQAHPDLSPPEAH